ncbi:hypothetical protein EUX98_g5113 [Antrodiella citrinella]|uniref:Fe2OG dioxygenase domain-containing protein n=1 Tax=Antrodiella citrinella TaxID=2447956 RepID=A0A4S4MV38_9APHY|nr:hypothetical protein EUX98_g5113 [Antrodiella citrinella]
MTQADGKDLWYAYPPFPEDVPTYPLLVVDYQLLLTRSKRGLKNHDTGDDEKMKFEQGDDGMSAGGSTDATGALDTVEFINVNKDDVHRTYTSTVNARMDFTIQPFVLKSLSINETILDIFNARLGLPEGTPAKPHNREEHSYSETRTIKHPMKPEQSPADIKAAIEAHIDFGSLVRSSRLGGLQILPPTYNDWQYVRPNSGHAICNIGDALPILSGGILRSNLHRVVPPPRAQSKSERWSLVYFTHPGNSVRQPWQKPQTLKL